jgi:hypothetical protein
MVMTSLRSYQDRHRVRFPLTRCYLQNHPRSTLVQYEVILPETLLQVTRESNTVEVAHSADPK